MAALPAPPALNPAITNNVRAAWMTLALAPAIAAIAWVEPHGAWPVLAFLLATIPLLPTLRDALGSGWGFPFRVLLSMALTTTESLGAQGGAMLALVAVASMVRGRDAAIPFHPVMIAVAIALAFQPATAIPVAGGIPVMLLTAWYVLAGVALVFARCIRWQAPAGMIAGAGLVLAVAGATGVSLADPALQRLLPAFALVAFLVVDDPPRTCMRSRARLVCGALAGSIAAAATLALHAAHHDNRLLLALVGAALLASAAAPALDAWFAPRGADRIAGT